MPLLHLFQSQNEFVATSVQNTPLEADGVVLVPLRVLGGLCCHRLGWNCRQFNDGTAAI